MEYFTPLSHTLPSTLSQLVKDWIRVTAPILDHFPNTTVRSATTGPIVCAKTKRLGTGDQRDRQRMLELRGFRHQDDRDQDIWLKRQGAGVISGIFARPNADLGREVQE